MESRLNKAAAPIILTDPVTKSNCYVLRTGKAAVVIDPNSFDLLNPLLQKWSIRTALVLLTHEHCDHIGGLNALREHYPVTVISSSACSRAIQNSRENMSRMMELFLYYESGQTVLTPYEPFVCQPADLHFSDTICFPFEGLLVQMKVLPGHTHGSSVIFLNGLLFCGDYLLPEKQVLTRLPGGDEKEYQKLAKPWLSRIPDGALIYPGHGEPFFMNQEVRSYHEL